MRKIFGVLWMIQFPAVALASNAGTVEIRFHGDLKPGGQILVSFESERGQYEAKNNEVAPFREAIVEATEKQAVYVARFEQVPFGNYTIRAFYDENSNRELDTNLVGYPKEAYGISNNARGLFGLPAYDAAKFTVESDEVIQEITLK